MLFGLPWLRKATRRAAGIIPFRNEAVAFRRHAAEIGTVEKTSGWDQLRMLAAFQATAIEGLE